MKILKNRRLLIIITVIALVLVGLRFRNGSNLKSDSSVANSNNLTAGETVFIQAAKQFALIIPAKWTVTETTSGKQTLIYPTSSKITNADAQTLIGQDVIIIETATNKKDSFDALISEIKSNIEKNGSTVSVTPKDYGALKASLLSVSGKDNYQQLYFNTPTIIIFTTKKEQPALDGLAKTLTIDLSSYANDIAQAANLTKQTNQNIATGKFSDIYKDTSDALKKLKNEEEFTNLLKGVSGDFSKTIQVWGVFVNKNSLGAAINIVDQDKITRRASFYYIKEGDRYLLDSLRVSNQLNTATSNPSATSPPTATPATAPTDTKK